MDRIRGSADRTPGFYPMIDHGIDPAPCILSTSSSRSRTKHPAGSRPCQPSSSSCCGSCQRWLPGGARNSSRSDDDAHRRRWSSRPASSLLPRHPPPLRTTPGDDQQLRAPSVRRSNPHLRHYRSESPDPRPRPSSPMFRKKVWSSGPRSDQAWSFPAPQDRPLRRLRCSKAGSMRERSVPTTSFTKYSVHL